MRGKGEKEEKGLVNDGRSAEEVGEVDVRSQPTAPNTMPPMEADEEPSASRGVGASRSSFQWPWAKDTTAQEVVEKDMKDPDSRSEDLGTRRKKATHTDSKPGASLPSKTGYNVSQKKKTQWKPPWEETWDKVVEVISAKWPDADSSKRKETDSGISADTSISSGSASNGIHTKTAGNEPSAPQGSSSIRELYSPPADAADSKLEQPPQQRKGPKWPKMPWVQEGNEETTASDTKPGVKRSSGPRISTVETVTSSEEERADSLRARTKSAVSEETRSQRDPSAGSETSSTSTISKKEADDGKIPNTQSYGNSDKKPALQLPPVRSQLKVGHIDVASIPQRDVATIRLIFGSETFFATETLSPPGGLIFRGNLRGEPKATIAKLEDRLTSRLGDKYTLCLAEGEEDLRPVVVIVPTARDKRPATPRQQFFAIVIAFITISTCLARGVFAASYKPMIQSYYPIAGASMFKKFFSVPTAISLTTAASIWIIILLSQIIQRVVAARYRTRVALPYFIPSFQLGSFGAIVQLASPTPTRAALFDIAFAGAATLVIASLALLLIGLRLSTTFSGVVPIPMSTVSSSLVMGFLTQQVPQGQVLVDYGRSLIALHPLAVIGANCLTIAALNLLPMRQLDGGRIISALYGRRTAVFASRVTVLFLLLASTKNPYFVVFLAAVTFGPWSVDRPSKNELTEPDGVRTIVGYLFMLLMIGVLLPYPACKFFGTL